MIELYNLCATEDGATPALLLPLDPSSAHLSGLKTFVAAMNAVDIDDQKKKRG